MLGRLGIEEEVVGVLDLTHVESGFQQLLLGCLGLLGYFLLLCCLRLSNLGGRSLGEQGYWRGAVNEEGRALLFEGGAAHLVGADIVFLSDG